MTKKKKKSSVQEDIQARAWSAIVLHAALILAALGLALDLIVRGTMGVSICPTEACRIVGEYVRIGESNLVLMGFIFFLILWLVYFFSRRYNRSWMWGLCTIMLLGAMSFDGCLMGFQFLVIMEPCLLCIIVACSLFAILALFALVRKKAFLFILGLSVWLAGGAAGGMLQPPAASVGDRSGLEDVGVIRWTHPDTQEWPRFHFFFSLHCPHCTEILLRLAQEGPGPMNYSWNFIPLDLESDDLKKIAALKEMDLSSENPFYKILLMEQQRDIPQVEIPGNLPEKIQQARFYFQSRGFRGVPTTVVQKSPDEKLILAGAAEALDYFRDRNIISTPH
ncbi:hypothetical protein [Desulfonatronospira sp.]|uniref:hypothetical protein n=1 Tax=Desulfonatronospira sp. TaxID=1962951 RepID=UPI0025C50E26|nr:hypothetical protein [Desulfonatronospira sp.]